MALARLGQICLDCEDPAGLAAFWAALLGGEVAPIDDDVVVQRDLSPNKASAIRFCTSVSPRLDRIRAGVSSSRSSTRSSAGATCVAARLDAGGL